MKLAFSTLRQSEFGMVDGYSMAKDLGFEALRSAGWATRCSTANQALSAGEPAQNLAQLKKIPHEHYPAFLPAPASLKIRKAEETRRELKQPSTWPPSWEAPLSVFWAI